jgi:hypothetical protein
MKEVLKPIIKLSLFSLFLFLITVAEDQFHLNFFHVHKWFLLIFFFLLNLLTTAFIHLGINKNKENLAVFYFGAMIFRFFISLMVAFVFIYKGVDEKVMFVINFFVFYLLFLMFEIYSLLTNLRPNFK